MKLPWSRREEIPCIEMVELASSYLDGGLAADLRRRCREHLEGCDACLAFFDQVSKTIALLRRSVTRTLTVPERQRLLASFKQARA